MKPVSLVHYGDIGLSANLDQAMSKKKKDLEQNISLSDLKQNLLI